MSWQQFSTVLRTFLGTNKLLARLGRILKININIRDQILRGSPYAKSKQPPSTRTGQGRSASRGAHRTTLSDRFKRLEVFEEPLLVNLESFVRHLKEKGQSTVNSLATLLALCRFSALLRPLSGGTPDTTTPKSAAERATPHIAPLAIGVELTTDPLLINSQAQPLH